MSCVVYACDNVPRGMFSSGQLCRRQIIRKALGGNFQPEGYCQGPIIFGIIFREQSSRGQLSGGQFSSGAIARWMGGGEGQLARGQIKLSYGVGVN